MKTILRKVDLGNIILKRKGLKPTGSFYNKYVLIMPASF
ncbi:MAG: hypothetical protein JWR38_1183 [Mucilaginibacter sp.]|nr:hypothetical protein [Mucilaginibacter sp.]